MEKPTPETLADLAQFLQLLTDRIDLFEKKIDADLITVAEKILGNIFRLAEALQSRVSDIERSDANLKHRLAMLEERLTELEKKLNLPPTRIQ